MPSPQPNLIDVTRALASLLKINVSRMMQPDTIDVTFLPPEKADEVGGTHLNLYLYLAAHDAEGGPNLPMHGGRGNVISTVPFPLKLYYVLTPHAFDLTDDIDIAGQQELMGLGMKTLHDHPVIHDDYQIGATPIMPATATLGGGKIEVCLRPITPDETVSFWSTDQVRTPRLAAYYEVRTLLLPPEEETSAGAPVADVALGVRAGGPPRLFSCSSVQSFTQPAALGGATLSVDRAPAVAMLRAAPLADAEVTASGLALGDGSDAILLLRGDMLPGGQIALDPADNPAWNIIVSEQSLSFTVNSIAQPRDGAAVDLLPGLYTMALLRRRTLATEDGMTTSAEVESNALPFAIGPTIRNADMAGGNVRVEIVAGYAAENALAQAKLSVGMENFIQLDDAGMASPVDPGTFAEPSSTIYEAIPRSPLASGPYPVRLTVNGAESQPFWMQVA